MGDDMDEKMNELVRVEVERRLSDPVYLQEALSLQIERNKRLAETIQSREREIEALVPVKAFYKAVTESDDWMEMAAAVKVLAIPGYGRNNTFALLRDRQILRHNGNEPYQQYVERGLFKSIEQIFENSYGETMINRKPMVSQKGLDFIRKLVTGVEM
jgi:phage antirepressor YoqD-like protein